MSTLTLLALIAALAGAMLWLLLTFRQNLFYIFIPFNALVDTLIYYLQGRVPIGPVRGVILVGFLVIFFAQLKRGAMAVVIMLYLGYLMLLSLVQSSDLGNSLDSTIKVSIPFLMYLFAAKQITRFDDMRRLNLMTVLAVTVIILQLVVAQFVDAGQDAAYHFEQGLRLGGGNIQTTYTLALGFAVLPLCYVYATGKTQRLLLITAICVGALLTLMLLRRVSILVIVFAAAMMLLNMRHNRRIAGLMLVAGLMLTALAFTQLDLIYELYLHRTQDRSLEQENRYKETLFVFREMFTENSLGSVLFGQEVFNSAYHIWTKRVFAYARKLHVDYNILLHGTGLLGLLWYFFIHLLIYLAFYKTKPVWPWFRFEVMSFKILFFASFIVSLSGSIENITYRSLTFIYLAGITALLGQQLQQRRAAAAAVA